MKAAQFITFVAIGLSCVGCSSKDSKAIKAVESAVREQLRDPNSATFSNVRVVDGNIVCGEVNSKNGFGGYAGKQRFLGTFTGSTAQVDIFGADTGENGKTLCDTYDEAADAVIKEDQQKSRKP